MKQWNDLRYTFLFWVLMYRTVEKERKIKKKKTLKSVVLLSNTGTSL